MNVSVDKEALWDIHIRINCLTDTMRLFTDAMENAVYQNVLLCLTDCADHISDDLAVMVDSVI